jgi:D-3-phosphoglycerate dehydrogenase
MKRIIITIPDFGQNIDSFVSDLRDRGFEVAWQPLFDTPDTMKVINTARGHNAVIAGGEIWNRQVLQELCGDVEIITRYGTGVDKVDIEAATELGIAVANAPGTNSTAVAEQAVGMMICLSRELLEYDREIREGTWERKVTPGLAGKTVGLVGFGAIAKEVSRLLQGFSVRLLAYDTEEDRKAARELGVDFTGLDQLLAESDFVSLHIPHTEQTTGMVDEKFLSKMKQGAYLINTSRGRIVKEADLISALDKRRIAGAGLDVFERQPVEENNPLLKLRRTVFSPHVSAMSEQGAEAMMVCCVNTIVDFYAGKDPENVLNRAYKKVKRPAGSH